MAQILAGESPIDNEIATIRSQIEALRHRRSLLSHSLLTSRTLKRQLSLAKPTSSLPRSSIDTAQDLAHEHEHTSVENLHRTLAGITAFRVQDPDPNAVDEGRVLGVRIDVFSPEERAFQTPYYVLLNRPDGEGGELKVHKHTIPAFVPLQTLVGRYLPFREEDAPEKQGTGQDLSKFVRALRKELVAHHKRIDAFQRLKREVGKRHGVEEVKMLDVSGKEVEIVFSNKIVARLRITTSGKIEKVAVGPSQALDEVPENAVKSYREIKKAIEGGDSRIDSLLVRLRKRATIG